MQKTIPSYIRDAILKDENKILREEPQPVERVPVDEPNTREISNNGENRGDSTNIDDALQNEQTRAPENSNNQTQSPSRLIFESTNSYPEITDAEPSLFEVRQLKRLASSRKSEFSAVNTYLYQYFILRKTFPQVADALLNISIVEMEHFQRLSNAIVDFGGNPNLTDGRGNVWTGRNISQVKNVREILNFDIKAEREAIDAYEEAAIRTRNDSLRELYRRIIADEKLHIVVLEELLKNL